MMTRRSALKSGLTATGAVVLAGGLQSTATAALSKEPVLLKKGSVVLFQGDSITDADRDRKRSGPNEAGALGRGYPFLLASSLLMRNPELELKVFNRGISGNKIPDLEKRWQVDCIDLKPDVLSILIGVNDIWHKLDGKYDGTVEVYEEGFAALLDKTRGVLPDTRLVICEPFVLRCGAVNERWFPEFDERKAAAKRVATAAGAVWVPFQEAFDAEVAKNGKPGYWAGDGVHPSVAGHMFMARSWQAATGL